MRAGAVLLALGLLSAGASADPRDPELAILERAVADYPDDAELLWALARALERRDRPVAAADRVEEFEWRWPQKRPEALLLLGRLRYEAGQDRRALAALERALDREPGLGTAHFYRGLALRRLGRLDAAERALESAAELEPGLAAEASLLLGVGRMGRGDASGGRAALEQAARGGAAPAVRALARRALARPGAPSEPRVSLFASAAAELDSNVTLESEDPLPGATTDEDDARLALGAGLLARPLRRARGEVVLGYRCGQSLHADLDAYDLQSHVALGSALWRAGERLALRVDAIYAASLRDGKRYARSVTAQPSAVLALGPRMGLLRIWGGATRRGYFDDPPFPSLDRDATTLGLGLAHHRSLPWRAGAWASLGARFVHTHSDGSRDLLGFRGDYDAVTWEGSAQAHVPLAREISASASLHVSRDRYLHHNLVDALTDGGIGTPDPDRRLDTVVRWKLALQRPLSRFVGVELAWRYTRQLSNVDAYDYARHVVGVSVRTAM